MRLNPQAVAVIRAEVLNLVGADARVRLFGSRLDDQARGGDIDLLLELSDVVEEPAHMASQLSARISRALGGRQVDVLISAPNLQHLPIHEAALRNGIPL